MKFKKTLLLSASITLISTSAFAADDYDRSSYKKDHDRSSYKKDYDRPTYKGKKGHKDGVEDLAVSLSEKQSASAAANNESSAASASENSSANALEEIKLKTDKDSIGSVAVDSKVDIIDDVSAKGAEAFNAFHSSVNNANLDATVSYNHNYVNNTATKYSTVNNSNNIKHNTVTGIGAFNQNTGGNSLIQSNVSVQGNLGLGKMSHH